MRANVKDSHIETRRALQRDRLTALSRENRLVKLWYTGSDAVVQGLGLCYDRDYTDSGVRDVAVAKPSNTNNLTFAGIVAQAYTATTGGQWVYVYEPGAMCDVLVSQSVSIGGVGTCIAGGSDAGKIGPLGFMGRGTVQMTEAGSSGDLVAAYLSGGSESGLIETLTAVDGGTVAAMVGGFTLVTGSTLVAGNSTDTLADATLFDLRKGFKTTASLGSTYGHVVTITNCLESDDYTPIGSFELHSSGDRVFLRWRDDAWMIEHHTDAILNN